MKKLMFVLIALVFCLPAYSDILIYSVTGGARGIVEWDADQFVLGRTNVKGFLVLDVDVAVPEVDASALILYGRNFDGEKVQATFDDVMDADGFAIYEVDSYTVSAETYYGGLYYARVIGRARARYIGSDDEQIVPMLLKGVMYIDGLPFDNVGEVVGCGQLRLDLKLGWIRDANEGGEGFDDVVAAIVEYLVDKGYAD